MIEARARAYRLGAPAAFVAGLALAVALAGCAPSASDAPASSTDPTGTAIPLVIDTDMAPDDVVAILSLVRDPRVDVRAITVVGTGEAHCPGGMFVARSILTMLDVTLVPVACGRWEPIGDAQPFPDEWRAGADVANGLGLVSPAFAPDDRDAEQVIVELAKAEAAAGGRLTVLTLGTLTNVAGALALDPDLPNRVRLVSMLGAISVPGNVQAGEGQGGEPTAEWNAHADPSAVRIALEGGFDWTLVPLDATNDIPLTAELFGALESDHDAAPADIVYELWARNPFMLSGGFYLWDPLAAAVVRDPSVVTTRSAALSVVEGEGLDGGRLVETPDGAQVTVATGADRAAFENLLLPALRLGAPRAAPFTPASTVRVIADAERCDVSVDVDPVPSGLTRLELEWQGEGAASAFLFSSDGIEWPEIEAFVAAPDFSDPPSVGEVAAISLESPGSGAGFGEVTTGPLGLVCVIGSFEDPILRLAGPFEVGR
jgi:inosine-uridine nucleoside N-ribohydrolase